MQTSTKSNVNIENLDQLSSNCCIHNGFGINILIEEIVYFGNGEDKCQVTLSKRDCMNDFKFFFFENI